MGLSTATMSSHPADYSRFNNVDAKYTDKLNQDQTDHCDEPIQHLDGAMPTLHYYPAMHYLQGNHSSQSPHGSLRSARPDPAWHDRHSRHSSSGPGSSVQQTKEQVDKQRCYWKKDLNTEARQYEMDTEIGYGTKSYHDRTRWDRVSGETTANGLRQVENMFAGRAVPTGRYIEAMD